ncbi:glyoxalase/bleomycin resistance/dioxygenase family protein [Pedococcus aerophilus]|uniref:Glyoxalase/bleomycin resistance/dioxygenase family protein n=2 Tax=Pedococcus aerophilus TaxID=436356 RepID=A0ABP6GVI1_9MICO
MAAWADTGGMDVRFVAGFAVITTDPALDKNLFVKTLGLPLQPPVSVPDSEYVYSENVAGAKHFGVWPLNEAAQTCFGQQTWPDTHLVPQATIEFEVDDVESAAQELVDRGFRLVHETRTEPWQQVVARFQSADGLLVGVCFTPWMHEG